MIIKFFQALLEALSDSSLPLKDIFLTFLGAVMVRTVLEFLLLGHVMYWRGDELLGMFMHYVSSFLFLGLVFTILFQKLTRLDVEKVLRVVFSSFPVLIIVPVIDTLFGFSKHYRPGYFIPGKDNSHLWWDFLTFFGPFKPLGVTPAIRIEIALMCCLSGIFVWLITRRIVRAVLASLLFYSVCFLYAIIPVILGWFHIDFNPQVGNWNFIFMKMFLLACVLMAVYIYGLMKPRVLRALINDIRLERVGFYLALVLLGGVSCFEISRDMTFLPQTLFDFPFIIMAVCCAILFSLITNNLADEKIDQISNPNRPSVTGVIDKIEYNAIAWVALILALVLSAVVSVGSVIIIAGFMGSYFLYSMPPIRLKRVPVFSKTAIGLNALLMYVLGFTMPGGILILSSTVIIFFLVMVSLSANVIDLKDVLGDREAGIKTLPVLLGEQWAKHLIGFLMFLTWVAAFFVFNLQGCFWLCVFAASIQYVMIILPKYADFWVITTQVTGLLFVIFFKVHVLVYALR